MIEQKSCTILSTLYLAFSFEGALACQISPKESPAAEELSNWTGRPNQQLYVAASLLAAFAMPRNLREVSRRSGSFRTPGRTTLPSRDVLRAPHFRSEINGKCRMAGLENRASICFGAFALGILDKSQSEYDDG